MKYLLISILFFFCPFAKAEKPDATNHLAWFVAKITSASDPSLYGSALLLHSNEREWIFATNAHVLPTDTKEWKNLRLISPIERYQESPVTVIGSAPGFDIAVVSIPRNPRGFSHEELNGFLLMHLKPLPRNTPIRAGFLGFPGIPQFADRIIPGLKTELSVKDAVSRMEEDKNNTSKLSLSFDLKFSANCPPLFLYRCYEVPILTWGFSGSAFVVEPAHTPGELSIQGIMSHYRPLSEQSFVIPIEEVLRVSQRILEGANRSGRPYMEVRDPQGMFEYLSPRSVKILKGSRTGQTVSRIGFLSVPGGGGESSGGGGGESSGGGGPQGDQKFRVNSFGNLAFIGNYSKIEGEIPQPFNWVGKQSHLGSVLKRITAFRGIQDLLGFEPGVYLADDQGKGGIIIRGDEFHPVINLPGFIRDYSNGSSLEFNYPPRISQLPGKFQMRNIGVQSHATIRRFRTPKEIGEIVRREGAVTNDTGFPSLRELGELMQIHATSNPPVDLIFASHGGRPMTAIMPTGKMVREGDDYLVQTQGMDDRKISFRVRDRFRRMGPTVFRYQGVIEILQSGFPGIHSKTAYGSVHLQYDPTDKNWELKCVFAYSLTPSEVESASMVTPEQINVGTLYLPLIQD